MKFVCFPKKQDLYLIYTSFEGFQSILFKNLYIQASSKNSIFFRLLRTRLGHIVRSFFKISISVPDGNAEYLGIVKKSKVILFELNNGEPVWVWRHESGQWSKSEFLGYQLIQEYTYKEISSKCDLVKKALSLHWSSVTEDDVKIHGDFTHFNILYGEREQLHFIDQKSNKHSKLFDFFYFYSYLRQCLDRCVTLSIKDENEIVSLLNDIIGSVCSYESAEAIQYDFDQMRIPSINGLNQQTKYAQDFLNALVIR